MRMFFGRWIPIAPVAVFLAACAVLWWIGPVVSVAADTVHPYTVVLDAGHGGADGGTTGRSGTLEKTLNLEIAQKAAAFLRFFGVPVRMTRTDDRSLHSPQAETLRAQKAEDLRQRCQIVQSVPGALYLGIHQNFYGDYLSHGAQVFYAPDNHGGKLLAETLQLHLQTALPQSGNRKAAVIPNANYIMQHLSCPAVILECGFLSNPEEEMLLCTPEYQAKIAFCISTAVLDAVSNGEICPGTVQR